MGAFFVSAFCLASAQAFCPKPGQLPNFSVQHIVDGDTLRLQDGRSVRLIGLNSPELGRDGRSAEPFAEAARRRLSELVAANDGRVGLQLGREPKDHYGRTLAHAYDGKGRNLEAQLLAEGLGYLVAIAPNVTLVECQQAAERIARQSRVGLWRRSPVQAPGQLSRGGFALIEGRIGRVERNRGGVWLALGDAVVLRVPPQALDGFDIGWLHSLAGHQVAVRGWVIDRSRRAAVKPGQARWMLPVTHESMLELLP